MIYIFIYFLFTLKKIFFNYIFENEKMFSFVQKMSTWSKRNEVKESDFSIEKCVSE